MRTAARSTFATGISLVDASAFTTSPIDPGTPLQRATAAASRCAGRYKSSAASGTHSGAEKGSGGSKGHSSSIGHSSSSDSWDHHSASL